MPSTLDSQSLKGIFGLFKGESGAGKSDAALSFPSPYVFDHDRKMPAIANKHFPGKEIHWDHFDNIFEVGEKLNYFLVNGCPYETLIGDSVTSLSYTALKTIDDVKSTNILKMLENVRKSAKGASTIEIRGYDYYNGEDNFLKFYIDVLKALWSRDGNPKHVIVIAHVLTSETKDIKTNLVTRSRKIVTAGKNIGAYIPAQFDEMYHFATGYPDIGSNSKTVPHLATTEAVGEDNAKTAYNFPSLIDFTNANFYEILNQYATFPESSLTEVVK